MVTFDGTCFSRALKVDGALFEGAINPIEIEKATSGIYRRRVLAAQITLHKGYYIFLKHSLMTKIILAKEG